VKQYAFVVKIISKAKWVVEAEALAAAEQQFEALRGAGEPPVEEEVVNSEIVSRLEDGVAVPPPSKKRYHVEVETGSGKKHYEVIADDENEAVIAGQGQFLSENPGQDFLTIAVQEATAGEAEAVEKAWLFNLDVVGYGEDPEEAWGNLLLYSLKQPPPCERVPDQDGSLENTNGADSPDFSQARRQAYRLAFGERDDGIHSS
jgi:hypothetical protein